MACLARVLASSIGLFMLVFGTGTYASDYAPELAAGIRSQGFGYSAGKNPATPGTWLIRYVFDEKHQGAAEQARIRGLALRLGVVDIAAAGYTHVSWQDNPTPIKLLVGMQSYPGFEYIMTGWKSAQPGGAQRVLVVADALVAINKQADPASTAASNSSAPPPRFAWPVQGAIAIKFGETLNGKTIRAILIRSTEDTTVRAADAGTVELAGDYSVSIVHAGGYRTSYLYTKAALVKKGDQVAAGQPITTVAKAGMNSSVPGAVLGFAVLRNHEPIDPLSVLPPQ